MPLYDYRCEDCNHVFEAMHGIDKPPPTCPNCGGKRVSKIITTISFKVDHGERLSRIEKRYKDYIRWGKYKDAAKFAEKAAQYVKHDKVKRMVEEGKERLLKKKRKIY